MGSNRYVQFDPAVIEQARQIDLLSYLQRYEPSNLKRVAGNVYCTREHDSLKISNGKWYWWSRDFGGYSALDYLMKVRELGFVEAVQTLTGDMGDWKPPPNVINLKQPLNDRQNVWKYQKGEGKSDSDGREKDVG